MQNHSWTIPNNLPSGLALSIERMIQAVLRAVDPCQAVIDHVNYQKHFLTIRNESSIEISHAGRFKVVAIGKAALAMVSGLDQVMGNSIDKGIIVTKHESHLTQISSEKYTVLLGSHPVPDEKSVNAARAVISFLEKCSQKDVILFLISGGASSLLCLPEAPLSLEDMQAVTSLLLASGASIQEMNTVRKHLDKVKGGKLAAMSSESRQVSLIISDVVDNTFASIGSGPTVADKSTFLDVKTVIESFGLWEAIPVVVKNFILDGIAGKQPETVKADHPVLSQSTVVLIASNRDGMSAARHQAKLEGFRVVLDHEPFTGEANLLGSQLVIKARRMQMSAISSRTPACVIFGGESTVTLHGNGKGGRNLELALGAVPALAEGDCEYLVTLATDGEDGPTDAAGACVSSETLQGIKKQHLDNGLALENNDSYEILEKTGSLIKTGPTGTNVNDLVFWFYYPEN